MKYSTWPNNVNPWPAKAYLLFLILSVLQVHSRHKMRSLLITSTILALSHAQCDTTLPDGSTCEGDRAKDYADPDECSMFYHCEAGCVTHDQCPPNKPLFDDRYHWCMKFEDVECGDRPCNNPDLCIHTTLAPTPSPDCGHYLDCDEAGDGYWPDPYNCRK